MMPKDRDKFTVALIIAGSGPTDRDGNNPWCRRKQQLENDSRSPS